MNIGDTTPWPKGVPYDPLLIQISLKTRGLTKRMAGRKTNNQRVNRARKVLAGVEEREAYDANPLEHAKTFLRRKGYKPVFDRAIVLGKGHDGYQIGRVKVDDGAGLIAYAREQGWAG